MEKTKSLQEKSFIMDINFLENPFFLFKQAGKIRTVAELEKDETISDEARKVLNLVTNNNKNSQVEFLSWSDSKGLKREMLVMSMMKIPRGFTMDVWFGLVGLYIRKSSPIPFDKETQTYDIDKDIMYFTLYELADFMKVSKGGKMLNKIKDAIIELKVANYFSLGSGTIYEKKKGKYMKSTNKGMSLILDYQFESIKKVKGQTNNDKCWVQFNRVLVDNIKYQYIKYLNPNLYFSLPSGLTRRLYGYIEGNKYSQNGTIYFYIKRSIAVLKNKIPIDCDYLYQVKNKLKIPLKNLIENGIITDYFYGDEVKINGIKEQCIYFIFKGTKEKIIEQLTYKQLEIALDKDEDENSFVMKIPESLLDYLVEVGFEKEIAQNDILGKHSKWEIIKYILWLEEKAFKKNTKTTKNFPGLLRYALESGTVHLERTHKHIIDFIEQEKLKSGDNIIEKEKQIKDMYEKYITEELLKFKKEDEMAYELLSETTIDDLNSMCDKKIAENNLVIKQAETDEEREKISKQRNEWIEFKEKQELSDLFKRHFQKSVVMIRKLMLFEDFRKKNL